MRKMVLLASAAFLFASVPAFAGHFNRQGAFVGKVDSRVERALRAFNRTGDAAALQAAIASIVSSNSGAADDAVFAARSLPPAAQAAVADGLAQAWANLAATNPNGAAKVKAASNYGSQSFQTAYNTQAATVTGEASAPGGGTTSGDQSAGNSSNSGSTPSGNVPSSGGGSGGGTPPSGS